MIRPPKGNNKAGFSPGKLAISDSRPVYPVSDNCFALFVKSIVFAVFKKNSADSAQ
jgi:hypothetical protein